MESNSRRQHEEPLLWAYAWNDTPERTGTAGDGLQRPTRLHAERLYARDRAQEGEYW